MTEYTVENKCVLTKMFFFSCSQKVLRENIAAYSAD